MTRTIDLPREDLVILQKILVDYLPPSSRIWAFGSRTNGSARRYSDLDLAVEDNEPMDPVMLSRLRDALSESDLTIKVDVIDLRTTDPAFRRIIEDDLIRFGVS